ncbi:SDR family NAD(P)-dependent oxidoreductase (plasmid) [Bacillus mycoides]|nr:SDR family NAD(P)-dependent oxidoreductase [Bacillus mycoides]
MDKVLEEKVVLITGAASGIGLEFAQIFAKEGAKVIIADLNSEAAQIAASQLKKKGFEVFAITCDTTKEGQLKQSINHTLEVFEHVDIIVNNGILQYIANVESSLTNKYERH